MSGTKEAKVRNWNLISIGVCIIIILLLAFSGCLEEENDKNRKDSGIIYNESENENEDDKNNTIPGKQNNITNSNMIYNNLSLQLSSSKYEYYVFEPLNLTLKIQNNSSQNLSINNFSLRNVFFKININELYYGTADIHNISSKNNNTINGNKWNTDNQVILTKNKNDSIIFDLNNISFYYKEIKKAKEFIWDSFKSFLNNSFWISWIKINCNITSFFIPTENISFVIPSNFLNVKITWKPIYNKIIKRNYFSKNGKDVLEIAESQDYPRLFNNKFDYFLSESYKMPEYIDYKVIEYYNNSIDQSIQEKKEVYENFNYTANVFLYQEIGIYNESGNISIFGDSEKKYEFSSNTRRFNKMLGLVNNSLQTIDGNYSLIINNSIICEMKLSYSNVYGSLAGWGMSLSQIIIFDANLEIIFIKIFHGGSWIA